MEKIITIPKGFELIKVNDNEYNIRESKKLEFSTTLLNVNKYRNEDPIPLAKSNQQWEEFNEAEIGCYSITDSGDCFYNWYAVNDSRGLAPVGWRIPTKEELEDLDSSTITHFPGYRSYNGSFNYKGDYAYVWSSSEHISNDGWSLDISSSKNAFMISSNKEYGFSVICVKDKTI